jgi:1,4-dihydroxy-2-naphthoyl-CoA hydrolase
MEAEAAEAMGEDSTERDGFGKLIGVAWADRGPDEARASVEVRPDLLQVNGIVHGGVYSSLAETVCSAATYAVVREEGMVAFGQSNSTTFLRPITEGHVNAIARPRHRGRTTWIWDAELTDDAGNVCALVRMTVAVRPRRG